MHVGLHCDLYTCNLGWPKNEVTTFDCRHLGNARINLYVLAHFDVVWFRVGLYICQFCGLFLFTVASTAPREMSICCAY